MWLLGIKDDHPSLLPKKKLSVRIDGIRFDQAIGSDPECSTSSGEHLPALYRIFATWGCEPRSAQYSRGSSISALAAFGGMLAIILIGRSYAENFWAASKSTRHIITLPVESQQRSKKATSTRQSPFLAVSYTDILQAKPTESRTMNT